MYGDCSCFERIFEQLDVCARASGVRDLQLSLNEADGAMANCAGPLKGCVSGCVAYWCCARGCVALYGEHGGREDGRVLVAYLRVRDAGGVAVLEQLAALQHARVPQLGD